MRQIKVSRLPKLLVIVGETASGKSALAMELARRFNGEIICADSRTVYRGMDIGTAKPTTEEQEEIRHHLLDVVEPDQKFTAADFKRLAEQAIDDIASRGKLPILVGGSGLYIDSVLYDFEFRTPPSQEQRHALEEKSVDELQQILINRGIELPNNPRNPRHLIRAVESGGETAARKELRPNTLVLGLNVPRDQLKERIEQRVDDMLQAGLVDEIRQLAGRFGWDVQAMQAPAYRAFRGYLEGAEELENAKQKFVKNDLGLAKRQRTWFKRNKSIQWFTTPVNQQEIVDSLTTFLSS